MKVHVEDAIIGLMLVISASLVVFFYSIFISEYGLHHYLNVEILSLITIVLGFALALAIGDLLSKSVKNRVFGFFMLFVSVFTLIRWYYLFKILPLCIGALLGFVASAISLYEKRDLWLRYISALIVAITAYFCLDYLRFLTERMGNDTKMIIAFTISLIFFGLILYLLLKPER